MTKKKTEGERRDYGTSDNPMTTEEWEAPREKAVDLPEAPASLSATNTDSVPNPHRMEDLAVQHLGEARHALGRLGHFETNQAIASIDKALEWIAKCEATDEP